MSAVPSSQPSLPLFFSFWPAYFLANVHLFLFSQPHKLNALTKKFKPQHYEDIETLTSDAPQVMSRQATLNVGTVGHVAHGKSTVVRAISGVTTVRFRQ